MTDATQLELFSRGKQDSYFIDGNGRTLFDTRYEQRNGGTRETRVVQPTASFTFGTRIDIDLPRYGDILTAANIRIQLPTWLPPEVAAINLSPNYLVQVAASTGNGKACYGWINGVANLIVQKWQLWADRDMICEGFGEVNTWYPFLETTQNRAPIMQRIAAQHDGSTESIQRNATLPEIQFRVPIPGCQFTGDSGLPLYAMQAYQRLFLRLWLAPLADLTESSPIVSFVGDGYDPVYDPCPSPWLGRQITVTYPDGSVDDTTYRTVSDMSQLVVYGSYDVVHLDEDARAALRREPHEITFKQQYREELMFDANTFIPGSTLTKRLEIRGFFTSLFLRFLSLGRAEQNKYRDLAPPGGGEWITALSFVLNGIERVQEWDPVQYRELALKTRTRRDIPEELYMIIFGQEVDHEPVGALYLTRTHKAQLNFTLADIGIDPVTGSRGANVALFGIGWNVLRIADGFCTVQFDP